jgi:hypothetical protein
MNSVEGTFAPLWRVRQLSSLIRRPHERVKGGRGRTGWCPGRIWPRCRRAGSGTRSGGRSRRTRQPPSPRPQRRPSMSGTVCEMSGERAHMGSSTDQARRAVRVDVLHGRRPRRGRRGRRDHRRRRRRRHGLRRRHRPGRPDLVRVPRRARVRLRRARARGEVETLASAGDRESLVAGEVPVLSCGAGVARVYLSGPVIVRVCAGVEAAACVGISR